MRNRTTKRAHRVQEFYEKVTDDYQYWNAEQNMHFGIANRALDVFQLSKMINNLSEKVLQVFSKLDNPLLADLGCGMGGTMQFATKKFQQYDISGYTLASAQQKIGNQKLTDIQSANHIYQADYQSIPMSNASFDGAYAIESFCHSGCNPKTLQEAHRILKPNSKLVIADAFMRKRKVSKGANALKSKIEKLWKLDALISIDELRERLLMNGFKNVEIQELTWKIAPSVLYVPFVFSKFYLAKLGKWKSISLDSHDNAWASFYTLLTAFYSRAFGYYFITAEKI